MMRALLIACLVVSGCSRVSVREDAAGPHEAWLVLEAKRNERFRAGCAFSVSRDGRTVARAVSGESAPVVLAHLDPGRYDVRARYRKLGPMTTTVLVRQGRATVVSIELGRPGFLRDLLDLGRALLVGAAVVTGAVAYGVILLLIALL